MATTVLLRNKEKGKTKLGILGFSWTTFFFGLFVPLFRKDFKMFLPFFLVYLGAFYFMPYQYVEIDGMVTFQMTDDMGIYSMLSSVFYVLVNILGAFFYNNLYTKGLVKKGFYPVTVEEKHLLGSYNISVPEDFDDDDE